MRSDHVFSPDDYICLHHEQLYINKYSNWQLKCCDPCQLHKKTISYRYLKALSKIEANAVNTLLKLSGKFSIKPGQKLCHDSFYACNSSQSSEPSEQNRDEVDKSYYDVDAGIDSLNIGLKNFGCSPFNFQRINGKDRLAYGKQKIMQVQQSANEHITRILGYSKDDTYLPRDQAFCLSCKDLDEIIIAIKEKIQVSSKRSSISLLTLASSSWSIEKTKKAFEVINYMVKQARKLKFGSGMLAELPTNPGRSISDNTIEIVQKYYENDEISRMLPGEKDFVSMKAGNVHVHKQKRLIFMHLNELYSVFKKDHPDITVGISKFCELRPNNCITVGSRDSHSVCVCKIHQNVKLMISALPLTDKLTHHDLLEVLVCNTESKSCMLHRCDNCPGISALQLFIESKLEETMLEKDECVKFKQWTSTDRVTINEEIKPLSDCLEILVEDIVKLSVHHYIARNQSNYIKHLKETIKPNEAIITLHFAENYSFVIQYAIQGFH